MVPIASLSAPELAAYTERASRDYDALCSKRLHIDMTRGKPGPDQLALSSSMLTLPGNGDYVLADGGDARNYFGSVQGLPEARALFSRMLGAPPERIAVGNNSSLALMHDCIVYALLKGVPGGEPAMVGRPADHVPLPFAGLRPSFRDLRGLRHPHGARGHDR